MVLLRKRSTEHLISTIQIKSLTPWFFFFLNQHYVLHLSVGISLSFSIDWRVYILFNGFSNFHYLSWPSLASESQLLYFFDMSTWFFEHFLTFWNEMFKDHHVISLHQP